jgi:hypothetical protein
MFFGHNDPTNAAAAFDKDLVIACCNNYFARREARIQRDIDRAVEREMTDERSWFSRVILRTRGPAATREEAIERLKEDPKEFLEFSIWDRIHTRGESTAATVLTIRSMAINSSLPYVVLTDSGQFILDYKEEKK